MATIGEARHAIGTTRSKAEFYRMWQAGNHAGFTHAKALDAMGVRDAAPEVEALRTALLQGTERGRTIASILGENARLVQPFEGALLGYGEEAGSLDTTLKTLAAHYALELRLLTRIWSRMTYPLMTSFLAIFIAALPILMRSNIPTYLVVVAVGVALWYSFGGSVVTAYAAKYANRREFVLARLARGLASGIAAGLPLDRVVLLAAESTGHPQIIAHVKKRPAQVRATQPASETFSGCAIVPPEMIAAMRVGEASGDFSGSLRKLADLYES